MSLLPPAPNPPHDPTFWLLDSTIGWQAGELDQTEITPDSGAIMLQRLPGAGRLLAEPSGSFGGLTLPSNVALGPDGSVFLLDARSCTLKSYDPCICAFVDAPCFGGAGSGARQLQQPGGIGICAGNLFVCDSGNHRLSVFALRGYVLRAIWKPPIRPELPNEWQPIAITFDGRGRAFVADPANGGIHRFHPSGWWDGFLPGFGAVFAIAIDCQDRLYVAAQGAPDVRIVDRDGQPVDTADRPNQFATLVPALPFPVNADGSLVLAPPQAAGSQSSTSPCGSSGAVFDLHGARVAAKADASPFFQPSGDFYSEPLDSNLYRCQWHRIVLHGCIPSGSRVQIRTFTAETPLPIDQITAMPDTSWQTRATIMPGDDLPWEGMILSDAGRYLWLRLTLAGNGLVTPSICRVKVEYPRISLRRYLPAVFGSDPVAADFTDRFLAIFDTTFRSIESTLDNLPCYFDPLSTPAGAHAGDRHDFLTWLASWIGISLDRQWPEAKRRRILKEAGKLFPIRGTREGLRRQLLLLLDMEPDRICCPCDQPRSQCVEPPRNCAPEVKQPCAWEPPPLILEHFQLRRWLYLGAGRLGDQAAVWGSDIVNRSQLGRNAQAGHTKLVTTPDPLHDPFLVYAHRFTVFVPAKFGASDTLRRGLENMLESEKPSHTQGFLKYVEPRFRIGIQSSIGLDSVVGRYPEGVTLGESQLGRGTIIGEPPLRLGEPTFEIGVQSRIGETTRLD